MITSCPKISFCGTIMKLTLNNDPNNAVFRFNSAFKFHDGAGFSDLLVLLKKAPLIIHFNSLPRTITAI